MSHSSNEFSVPQSYIGTWVATLLLIVGFVLGLLTFPPLYDAPSADAPGTVLFVGRFHPILLHLPVGALGMLCIMELACLTRNGEAKLGLAALLTLWVGAAGSVMAVLAGIMLSREGGYEGGNFTLHQTLALVGTSGVLIALVIRILAMGQGNYELLHAYRAVFFLSFGIMGLGAHFGGNMSHGSNFLTKHAPEPLRSRMIAMDNWMLSFVEKPKPVEESALPPAATTPLPNPPPTASVSVTPSPAETLTSQPPEILGGIPPPALAGTEKMVFQHVILPILDAKCNNCHNEEKSKGDLRMDTYELAMTGGESGDNIVPGKPEDSLSIQLISLPEDDDDHMPPEGKDQLTTEEIALLRWWVKEGASNTLKVSEVQFPAETQAAVAAVLKGQP